MEARPPVDPRSAEDWYRQGNARQDEGRDDLAAGCYERAVALDPSHAKAWNNLGVSRQALGRDDLAAEAYLRALERNPSLPQASLNLGRLADKRGDVAAAEGYLARATACDPADADAWEFLGHVRLRLGRTAQAVEAFGAWLERDRSRLAPYLVLAGIEIQRGDHAAAEKLFAAALEHHPRDPTLLHMRAAVCGETTVKPSEGYVAQLFDGMAEDFDQKLRNLGYNVPEMLAREALPVLQLARPARVLDLGCGTGLLGAALAGAGAQITGVDLSPEMLKRAAGRGVYATLVTGDLVEAARNVAPGSLHAMLAADVFVYIGDLEPAFEAAARALGPGGLFAFTVEAAENGDFVLRPNGRYAHSAQYLRRLAAGKHLSEHRIERIRGRREHGVPVEGWLVSFIR